MVKQQVKVFVRTRPTTKFAADRVKITPEDRKIDIKLKPRNNRTLNNRKKTHSFRYDGILHNSSQEDVFQAIAVDTIKNCFDGYNGTIFCYGQTGAGKTYTMTGPPDDTSDYRRRGLIPRTIEQVFEEVHNRPERSFNLSVSYLEIYNEKLSDLLNAQTSTSTSPAKGRGMQILETGKSEIIVRNLKKFPIKDEEDGLSLMFEGETQRAICEHVLNSDSSRSHAIFTVYIESRSRVESSGQTMRSKFHLVDLAGSERVKKTKSVGRVLEEAKYINKSLSFLEQVVIALSTPGRSHIPYRQSLLTYFLKDSIGGNSKTTMIANIWCEGKYIEETLGTLKFGTRVMRVSNTAVVNVELNPSMLLSRFEKQVKELKQELAMHDQLKGITEVQYDVYTDEQRLELRKSIWKFIKYDDGGGDDAGGGNDLLEDSINSNDPEAQEIQEEVFNVRNLRQVKESFLQFKVIVKNLQREVDVLKRDLETEKEKVAAAHGGTAPTTTELPTTSSEQQQKGGRGKTGRKAKKGGKGGKKGKGGQVSDDSTQKVRKIVVGEIDDNDGFAAGEGIPYEEKTNNSGMTRNRVLSKKSTGKRQKKKKKKEEEELDELMGEEIEELEGEVNEEEEDYDDDDDDGRPPPPSKDEAYEEFKTKEGSKGKEIFTSLSDNIRKHNDTKKQYIDCGKKMNQQKREIDQVKGQINRKKLFLQSDEKNNNNNSNINSSRIDADSDENNIVDEEMLMLYETLKTKKKGYKEAYNDRKSLKDELNFLGGRINVMKKKMIIEFEKDYETKHGRKKKKKKQQQKQQQHDDDDDFEKESEVDEDDVLDDGEMFEKLEEKRIMKKDPESYTFYKAFQKSKVHQKHRKNKRR